jgi:methionine sulfoxide reductase heme-binding subunit
MATINQWTAHPRTKLALHLAAALPLAWLVYAAFADLLGANPAEALERSTGDWTLRMLCVVLTVTPLRVAMGWTALARHRRMLGLWTFAYAMLHLLCYSWFDMGFDVTGIAADIVKRPFILVGFTAAVLLLALAATSFNRAIKFMGAKRWQRLHKAVYAVAVLAILHFFWMRAGKNNFAEVAIYAAILATLLGWRVQNYIKNKRKPSPALGEKLSNS